MFTMQTFDADAGEERPVPDQRQDPGDEDRIGTSKFDMTLYSVESEEELSFAIVYCSKLFKTESIERFITYFRKIVSLIVKAPGMKLREIEIISEEEKKRLLYDFNDTAADYPKDRTIHELFAKQVEKMPDRAALVGMAPAQGAENLHAVCRMPYAITYRELNEKSNQLAGYLRKRGVGPGVVVPLMVERSLEMIIGTFGILKAGGAYLPIEPGSPGKRLAYILGDSAAQLLLTRGAYMDRIPGGCEIVDLGEVGIYGGEKTGLVPEDVNTSHDPIYTIYTSGSTGNPKGVVIEHGSVVNILSCLFKLYPFFERDTYIFKTSYVFDVSVSELFGWFRGGGRLAILEPGAEKDPERIVEVIEELGVSHINFVPSMFNVFVDFLDRHNISRLCGLRYIFLAGEALSPVIVNRFRELGSNIRLENIYGPTEATIYASGYPLWEWDGVGGVSIGKPLQNMRLYILSNYNHLQPVGVVGELGIAGVGLARGYLNNPELTADKFLSVSNRSYMSYRSYGPKKIYKTGDLCRWAADGNIEFLGRLDQQTKIRGFRIELGEIENVLLSHEKIKEAVVTVRGDGSGNKHLCAYIAAVGSFDNTSAQLKEYLSGSLPEYMIPVYFTELEKIPLTASGKIDRKALPKPGLESGEEYEAPGDDMEKQLVTIWSEVLGLEEDIIGINDNFFNLGGHSLNAVVLMSKINNITNRQLPLVDLFKAPNIKKLAEYIKTGTPGNQLLPKKDDNLVLLKKGNGRSNCLFLFHGGYGQVEGYIEFCGVLGSEFNCWGIRADRFEDYAPQNLTIENVSGKYVEKIRNVQPHGPYYIAGRCIGGTLAFEIANQLEQLKEEVRFLGLINSPVPEPSHVKMVKKFTFKSELKWVQRYLKMDDTIKANLKQKQVSELKQAWMLIVDYLESGNLNRDIVKEVLKRVKNVLTEDEAQVIPNYHRLGIGEMLKYLNIGRTFINARAFYIPNRKINATVHYFAGTQSKVDNKDKWNIYTSKPVKFYEVTGDNYSIFKMPQTVEFAKIFASIFMANN
jgi:fengycin family lipopeptide synthetase D